jgi:oligopeptide/dipeptide ABC transporter ATP-binding protein
MPLLEVKNLNTAFDTDRGLVQVLKDVSFSVEKGKTLGIVGESGCGKSVTSLSIMRLLPKPAGRVLSGEILLEGKNLLDLPFEEMHNIRGKKISMIFQEPMTALNPVHKIGKQLGEGYKLHFPNMSDSDIVSESINILNEVGIPLPEQRLNEYPHQLSGGMRQRVMIAMALSCKPDIIIADEPTTALDVTIQAQILRLMNNLQKEKGTAIVFITHDLGVIAQISDDVAVMYCGQVVEQASVRELFANPKHPYTQGLLNSIPRLSDPSKEHLNTIEGMVPPLSDLPDGCRFAERCPHKEDSCLTGLIPIQDINGETLSTVRCGKWDNLG